MSETTFSANPRTEFGTKAAQRYRAGGQVPLTIAKRGADSQHVTVSDHDAEALRGLLSHVVVLKLDGADHEVLVKQVDTDPLTDHVRHVDGIAVTADQDVEVAIPVRPDTKTDCPGLKAGGLLEQMLRKVTIRVAAGQIPEQLRIDLTGVRIGQTLYASQVELPEGARLITKPRTALLTIVKTRGLRRAEATGGEEAAS